MLLVDGVKRSSIIPSAGAVLVQPSLHAREANGGTRNIYFPMQNLEKMRLRTSSGVVWPVRESNAHSAR
jgi:hypothetical protein